MKTKHTKEFSTVGNERAGNDAIDFANAKRVELNDTYAVAMELDEVKNIITVYWFE